MNHRESNDIPGVALLCAALLAIAIAIICAVAWWPK